jgi:regulator of sigma E protease
VPGKAGPERLTFKNIVSQKGPDDMAPRLGLEPAVEPVIAYILPDSPEEQFGLMVGDRILAVNGQSVERWRQAATLLEDAPSNRVTLTIERQGRKKTIKIDPPRYMRLYLGMAPPLVVGSLDTDGPAAKAGLLRGDRIVRIDDLAWPTAEQLVEKIRSTPDGGTVRLAVERNGETLDLTCRPAVYGGEKGPRIGVAQQPAVGRPVQVGSVDPDSPAAKAGLLPGDVIVAIGPDAARPHTWEDILSTFGAGKGKPFDLQIQRGAQRLSTQLKPAYKPVERFTLSASKPGMVAHEMLPVLYNPLKAAARGLHRTWIWMAQSYMSIVQMARGQISTESVGGPVLIVDVSLRIASLGLGTFLDLWGKLSVFIAVVNFLPIPPFDGGHALFVVIDKIKGSPVSLKVRTWIWGAGWAAVGVLFLLVMWQDIARLIT